MFLLSTQKVVFICVFNHFMTLYITLKEGIMSNENDSRLDNLINLLKQKYLELMQKVKIRLESILNFYYLKNKLNQEVVKNQKTKILIKFDKNGIMMYYRKQSFWDDYAKKLTIIDSYVNILNVVSNLGGYFICKKEVRLVLLGIQ